MHTIYIAGKVTGLPIHTTTMKFGAAQQQLRDKYPQATILNPLQIVNDWHCTWQQAMRKCIQAMLMADALYMLPDWQQSKGATLEHTIAKALGIDILYADATSAAIGNHPQPYFD